MRNKIKKGLVLCNEDQILMFKRMYSHKDLELNINDIVDSIPDDKLDWAMQQVQRTLTNRKETK